MASDDTEEKEKSTQSPKEVETRCSNGRESSNVSTGGELNPAFIHDEKRRVSISMEAIQADNEKQRKISTTSHEGRYKSMMANGESLRLPADGEQKYAMPFRDEKMRRYTYESIEDQQDVRNSWWYDLCTKCRRKETGAGWEPSYWPLLCPYPFCPTYRHIARVMSLFIIGLLVWGIIYSIIGDDVAPGGQLFDIAVLCILAHFGGWLFRMLNLPALVGMLLVGIIYQNLGLINIRGGYQEFVAVLRRFALVMILTRAGLDLDSEALKRLFCTVLRMGLIPWLSECLLLTCLVHYLLGFPWTWGLLLGSIVAAVAPAVVVPCLFRLRNKGYGVSKGIPTLVIAVSGIDDAASVAAFGIIHGIMFSNNSLYYNLILGPASILIGVGYGLIWGLIAKYVPEKDDPFAVPLRIILLLCSGLIAVLGSEAIHMDGAGPLGVISAAFMSIYVWSKQGWEIDDNPVATAYEIFWMIFEPILFSLTGTQLKLKDLNPDVFAIGCAILISGIVLRIVITVLSGVGTSLNMKEKIFVAISWMAKASVQAALGPMVYDAFKEDKGSDEHDYASITLMMCILSVILTAPLGAIIITLTGKKLLKKTSAISALPEGWRRSHRPSLRDIQVTDDDDDDDDEDGEKHNNKYKPSNQTTEPIPSVVITSQP